MPYEFPAGIKFIAIGDNNLLSLLFWTRNFLVDLFWQERAFKQRHGVYRMYIESFYMDFFYRVLIGWVF